MKLIAFISFLFFSNPLLANPFIDYLGTHDINEISCEMDAGYPGLFTECNFDKVEINFDVNQESIYMLFKNKDDFMTYALGAESKYKKGLCEITGHYYEGRHVTAGHTFEILRPYICVKGTKSTYFQENTTISYNKSWELILEIKGFQKGPNSTEKLNVKVKL